jgi:hypothetical protein
MAFRHTFGQLSPATFDPPIIRSTHLRTDQSIEPDDKGVFILYKKERPDWCGTSQARRCEMNAEEN